jgi:hypothetical protein
MKITLNTLTKVTRVIMVVCSNKYGLHPKDKVYIRYCILVGSHLDSLFLDDPSEATVLGILKSCDPDVVQEAVQAPCPFCQARSENPYDVQ